ncbi:MAG: hypothetical protein RLZZ297_1573 [Chloroflexota bacterium]
MARHHTSADITAYLDLYFTVPAARTAYIRFWIDSLVASHALAPQRWVVTHNPARRNEHLNINLGLLHTIMLRDGDVQVMIDYDTRPPLPNSDDADWYASEPDPRVGVYPSVPGSSYTIFNPDVFHEYAALLWPAHHATLVKAAQTRINPGVVSLHTPAALHAFAAAEADYLYQRHGVHALPISAY